VIRFEDIPFTLGEKRLLDYQYRVHYKKLKTNNSNEITCKEQEKWAVLHENAIKKIAQ